MAIHLVRRACVREQPQQCESLSYKRATPSLILYGACRAFSNSFTSEDDAIYGDAGSAPPMDTNGDTNGGNEEEEAHESDGGGEEEEDSEDVSRRVQTRDLS